MSITFKMETPPSSNKRILKSFRSSATTSIDNFQATSTTQSPETSDVVSLSRPLSAHSTLLSRYHKPISRTQSLKDGFAPKSRPVSRQSLTSMLTIHLFQKNYLDKEANSDDDSEHFKRNTINENGNLDSQRDQLFDNLEQDSSPDITNTLVHNEYNDFEEELENNISLMEQLNLKSDRILEAANEYSEDEISEDDVLDGPLHRRTFGEEDPQSLKWKNHQHHLFILSSAGKPIYTRYGDESKISDYMGIIQAIISFYADDGDSIRCINSNTHKIIFMLRDPLYFVLVSRSNETEDMLRDHLHCYYQQILSTLTQSQLNKAFEKSYNFDLRRLLSGTEPFLDTLSSRVTSIAPSHLLQCITTIRMELELRKKISKALKPNIAKKLEIFYILLANKYKLVHLLRSHKVNLYPSDLYLLLNLINSSPNFLITNQACWIPICLPKFNKSGYLYALIHFLKQDPPLALIIISPQRDMYEEVKAAHDHIIKNLNDDNLLDDIFVSIEKDGYDVGEIGIPGLRHFVYQSKGLFQYTGCKFQPPYILKKERKKLFEMYQTSYYALNSRFRPLRIHFSDTENETVVGWSTSQFTLLVTFTPYISKTTLVQSALKLVKWIQNDRDQLFITQTTLI